MNDEPHELEIRGDLQVTFEQLDDALSPLKGALPASFAVGIIYGSIGAPHMVTPSMYLPRILGTKMELPDPPTAEHVLSLLYSLHNHLVVMIEDDKLLQVRRKKYGTDKAGLMLFASDLWREAFAFGQGLGMGTYEESELPKTVLKSYSRLAEEMDELRRIIRRIDAKQKPYTEVETAERVNELRRHRTKTAQLMRTISHQLYVQRMERYKAQGVLRIGRNDPCPCGSGKKFKNCCMDKIRQSNPENN
jgi:hypothetical protein